MRMGKYFQSFLPSPLAVDSNAGDYYDLAYTYPSPMIKEGSNFE